MRRTMNSRVFFLIIASLMLVAIWSFYPKKNNDNTIRIGIVLPIQHVALDDIVRGFTEGLHAAIKDKTISIDVQNALGDINLQKSSINNFLNDRVDLLVPVATGVTHMAINLSPKDQPVLFLAADIPPDSEMARSRPGLMGVIDELGVVKQVNFIHAALPEAKKIAIIYSSNDKFPKEAQIFFDAAKTLGIVVQKLMIQNLAELYTVAGRIASDTDAIFILKDNVVASGIVALVQQANKLKIPLVTSDEGTNALGGAFALGVTEANIGRQGAKMAASYLVERTDPGIQYLDDIQVFINSKACFEQNVDIEALLKASANLHYVVNKR